MTGTHAIEITDLTKRYGDLVAVDHLSLTIGRGEIFGVLGPNGAGKTTLLMMLSTLLAPSSGKALVNGYDVTEQPSKVRQSIGMVFQDPSSDELLTGYENLKLHALMYDVPMKDIDRKIDAVLGLVDLVPRKHDKVKHYSGGMRRRMEIARGLLHAPGILFLDEPTLGLDPQTRDHIWQYIEGLARNTGMTIVLTTHYMEEAEQLCHRVAIVDHGKIVALDTPANLRQALGGDRVTLRGRDVRVDALAALSFVKEVERSGDTFLLRVESAGKNLQALLRVAGELEFVEVHAADLNDVFLHYTGTAIRDTEGGTLDQIRNRIRVK